ncbi:hypothetical protein BDW60DRAFT_220740 [Aspergillus nidulans var. acristatus]
MEQVCGADCNAQQTWGIAVTFSNAPLPAAQSTVNTWSKGSCVAESPTFSGEASSLQRHSNCTIVQVVSGDGCAALAERCGITAAEFTKYNSDESLCTLPDFSPQPNDDGSCATYTIMVDDSCLAIAAANNLTVDEIESFNTETWGWNGCDTLWVGTIMCLSTGDPPMPAPLDNAVCGLQVPGTEAPTNRTALADLNPCLLNACCDIWGQYGITAEFCTESKSKSSAPGTAAAGENGCISNCRTDIVTSDAPETYRQVVYFEGYNLDQECLYMDTSQLDTDTPTHLLSGASCILSISGWSFLTDPGMYAIFRNAVQSKNVDTVTINIANFITDNGLDRVNIDWEYPGAPDIPGIPAGADNEGELYTEFLTQLKSKLSDKTYLCPYEMETLGEILDYIVFMTYNLHGQWDYDNSFASDGCTSGNCLYSHVNMTETKTALAMIIKAGIPLNKVVVGVSSYSRSFKMTSADCTGPDCTYVGSKSDALAETWLDNSNSNILVYNKTEWVAYMDEDNKADRDAVYAGYNMGGSVNWAIDLAEFYEVPSNMYEEDDDGTHVLLETWSAVIKSVNEGMDPFVHGDCNGNWTNLTCSDPAVQGALDLTLDLWWSMLDCDDAWADAVQVYKEYYPSKYFTTAISNVYHGPQKMECSRLSEELYCLDTQSCTTSIVAEGSGPAGYEVLNSLIAIQGVCFLILPLFFFLYDIDLFFETFSPIPDYTMTFNLIIDSLGLVVPAAMALIFNSAHPDQLDTAKDITYTAVGTWVNIPKDSNAGDYSDSMITLLTRIIKDGKLIKGSSAGNEAVEEISFKDKKTYIEKSFYAYVIPQVWQKSSQNIFVIDTRGLACDDSNPVSDYLDDSTANATKACFNKKRYYLVHLNGDASNSLCFPYKFSVPPGLDTFGTTLESESVVAWGRLEALDIVAL